MTRMDDVWKGQWGKVLAVLAAHDISSIGSQTGSHLIYAFGTDGLIGARRRLLGAFMRGDWPPTGR
jgi:hypothetical protein